MPALQLLHNSGNRRLGSLATPSPPTLPLRAGKPERSLYLSPRVSESYNGTSPKTIIASLPGGSADTVGDPWRKFVRNHYWLDILTVNGTTVSRAVWQGPQVRTKGIIIRQKLYTNTGGVRGVTP